VLGIEMIKSDYQEDKYLGCSVLSEIHKEIDRDDMNMNMLIDIIKDKCNELGACGTLALKIFRPYSLICRDNTIFKAGFRNDENIWMRRISCVAFIARVKKGDQKPNYEGFIILCLLFVKVL
jgi:hypothetical protein